MDGAGAVDAVEQDPAGAGGGDAAPPKTSRLEPRRLGCESIASGSALTTVRGGATSDETSWTSQVTDGGMAIEAEPPKIGGQCNDPAVALIIPTGEEEKEDPPQ